MSANHGTFVWYELMTGDLPAAESFYRRVMGWNSEDSGLADRVYTIVSAGPNRVAGLMPIPQDVRDQGAGPMWSGYIAVDDVDDCARRVTRAAGAIHRAPQDIPGVGRYAVAADPQGATFMLFRGTGDPPPAPAPDTPGTVGWHELLASDGASAFAFYAELFGWTQTEAMDLGAMGIYQLFAISGEPAGGMMTKTPDMPGPAWLFYFNVDAIDAAVVRVRDGGGEVLNGPMEVPGGHWIVQCRDPQGATFALTAPKR